MTDKHEFTYGKAGVDTVIEAEAARILFYVGSQVEDGGYARGREVVVAHQIGRRCGTAAARGNRRCVFDFCESTFTHRQ